MESKSVTDRLDAFFDWLEAHDRLILIVCYAFISATLVFMAAKCAYGAELPNTPVRQEAIKVVIECADHKNAVQITTTDPRLPMALILAYSGALDPKDFIAFIAEIAPEQIELAHKYVEVCIPNKNRPV